MSLLLAGHKHSSFKMDCCFTPSDAYVVGSSGVALAKHNVSFCRWTAPRAGCLPACYTQQPHVGPYRALPTATDAQLLSVPLVPPPLLLGAITTADRTSPLS